MKVKEIRIWLTLNVKGKEHYTVIEKSCAEPISKDEINDALIIDIIRQDKKLDITNFVSEIRNMISHEIKHKDHPGEMLLEDRYNAALDASKMTESDIERFLLAIYGIQTKKLKKEDAPWGDAYEKEDVLSSAELAEYGFPSKMISWLAKPENRYKKIIGASDAPTMVEFRAPDNLKLIQIEFQATDEHIRISDENLLADPNYPQDDESEESYKATAIDLIRENDLYSSEGLLVWIVGLKAFGAYDEEHQNLAVFPDAAPEDIQKDLGTYLQAQWSYSKDYIVKSGNVYDHYKPWEHFPFG